MNACRLDLQLDDDHLGLERLLNTLRRRCVPVHSLAARRCRGGYQVTVEVEAALEPTLRWVLARMPGVAAAPEPEPQGFWAQWAAAETRNP
ncbi:MAG: hypothetical protein IT463_14520 [Planctomycetes bacterium]|nr:hypothetical protein [Planctomycetota bacterium]